MLFFFIDLIRTEIFASSSCEYFGFKATVTDLFSAQIHCPYVRFAFVDTLCHDLLAEKVTNKLYADQIWLLTQSW